jgi:hypothetical protein
VSSIWLAELPLVIQSCEYDRLHADRLGARPEARVPVPVDSLSYEGLCE